MVEEPVENVNAETVEVDSQAFIDASNAARKVYGRFNLAIIGDTGVGKSSLVNAVFGREHAEVGIGLPVTEGVHYYQDQSLGIWDFEGFEIGSAAQPAELLRKSLQTIAARPADEQIAVVWYCVASTAARLTQPAIDMIRELDAAGLPVILVLSKVEWIRNPITGNQHAPNDVEKFQAWLENPTDNQDKPLYLPIKRVVPTAAIAKSGKGAGHGLGELVAETLALSPENEKDAFRIAQRLNLPWKRQLARPVIAAAATASAAAAAVPIPVSDALALAPIQMTMMGRISAIYDLELRSMLGASALAQFGAQVTGKALASSFLKLLPGAGSVINASVAVALTTSTGEGWLRLCERIYKGEVDFSQIDDVWKHYSPTIVPVLKKIFEQAFVKYPTA